MYHGRYVKLFEGLGQIDNINGLLAIICCFYKSKPPLEWSIAASTTCRSGKKSGTAWTSLEQTKVTIEANPFTLDHRTPTHGCECFPHCS
jgi:hypothetical protein